jgi:uncharacterized protein DUF4214
MGWNSQGAKSRSYSLRHRPGMGRLGRRLHVESLEERAMLSVTADANAKIASNLYADVLGRLAAPSEVEYWRGQLAAGQSQDSVVVGFVLSTEHRSNVVQGLYHDYLGRGTDPGGEAYWVNVLGQGVSEFQLLALIVGSDEYYRNHGGDDAGFIRGLYHDVLQRPDPPGPSEIAYWHGVLESGRSRASVAEGFINSPEFIGVGVDEMYRDFLRRDADAGGRAYWINQFQHGATTFQIQRFLLDSAEYNGVAQRSVEPGSQLVLMGQPVDPLAHIKVEFADSQGFRLDVSPLAVASSEVSVVVPPLIDPSTGQVATGTVSVQVLVDNVPVRPATIGAIQIQTLPQSPFAAGTLTLAYVQGALQALEQVQTQLSALPAPSPFGSSNANVTTLSASDFATPALTADLAAEHDRLTQFQADLQALLGPEPTPTFNLGTVGGRNVTLSKEELMILDRMMYAGLDGVRTSPLQNGADTGQQRAAAAQANPTAANFKELLAGEPASPALSPETLQTVSDVLMSWGLQLQLGTLGASVVQPELLATPLPYIAYGSGLIIQSLSLMVDPANAGMLGELRGAVDSVLHYAKSQIDEVTSQATGLVHDALAAHSVASNDVQKAGPAGQILVSGGPDVTIHQVIGDEATFEVSLTKKPEGVVSINLTNGDPAHGVLSPGTLVFTPDNWWFPQRVSITAVDNQAADGNHHFAVTLSPAQSTTPDYQGANPSPNQINVTDINDNHAGVIVTPTSGLVTTEDGAAAQFTVQLTSKPLAPVKIILVSSDTSEGDVTPGSVTFDATNWNKPRVFTVYGKNDGVREGLIPYTIILGGANSADPAYNGLDVPDVSVVNVDNGQPTPTADTTGVWHGQFTESNPLGGISGTMSLQLKAFPKFTTIVTGSVTTEGSGTLDLIGTVAGQSFVFNIDLQPGFIIEQLTGKVVGNVMTGNIFLQDTHGGVTTGTFTLYKVA